MTNSDAHGMESVFRAAARLQQIVPDAILVGGTAAASHAHQRESHDDDHVVEHLRERFDAVLQVLEDSDGWISARFKRPVLILGSLDGIETGVRNLIRRIPLEVEIHETDHGPIRVPTLQEMMRLKAWMVLVRNATRDYLDLVASADRIGVDAPGLLSSIDDYYSDQTGVHGGRVAAQIARQLADPRPFDLSDVDLQHYRQLLPRWRDWTNVADASRALSVAILNELADDGQ